MNYNMHVYLMTGSQILFGPFIEMLYSFAYSCCKHIVKNCENYVLCAISFTMLVCSYLTYFAGINGFIVKHFCDNGMQIASVAVTCLICLFLYLDSRKNTKSTPSSHRLCKSIIMLLLVVGGGALYLCVFFPVILFCFVVLLLSYSAYTKKIKRQCLTDESEEQTDLLYRSRLFNRTHLQIRKLACREKKGLTIGICGQWGSGKSFFIDTLKKKLSDSLQEKEENLYSGKFSICPKVELWEASTLDDAWQRVVSALFYGIFERYPVKCEKLTKLIVSLLSIISSRFSVLNEIIELVRPDYNERNLQSIKERMGDRKMVLIFDDLERADFKIIQAMLPLFERLKNLPNLIVICAVAENEMKHVFRSNKMPFDFAQGHLNKLFDLRIEIPVLPYTAIENFQNHLLSTKYDDCKLVRTFLRKYPLGFDTSRQLIRVIEKLTSIERQYYEMCPYDFSLIGKDKESEQSLYSIKYVFLIEALRLTNPDLLNVLNKELRLKDFFKDIPAAVLFYSVSSITTDSWNRSLARYLPPDKGHMEEVLQKECDFKQKFPVLYRIIMKRGIEYSILLHLKSDFTSPEYRNIDYERLFEDAYLARYVRCSTLTVWEQEEVIGNPVYRGLSYSQRLSMFFLINDEKIETSYQEEAAFSLLEHHLSEVLRFLENPEISTAHNDEVATVNNTSLNSLLDEVILSFEQEVGAGERSFLRNYEKLDARYFIRFLESCWERKKEVSATVWEKIEKIFTLLFNLMPIGEKALHLAYYFGLLNNEYKSEKHDIYNNVIVKSAEYKNLIRVFCQLYGRSLMRHIFEYPDSLLEDKSRYTYAFQEYRNVPNDEYMLAIRSGIEDFLSGCSHKSTFIEHWVAFMGHQYRAASIRGGMDSSFADTAVYEQMKYIENRLQISPSYIANLPNKEAIHKACTISIASLQKDYAQWQDDRDKERKEKYSSGIMSLISLIANIKDYTI